MDDLPTTPCRACEAPLTFAKHEDTGRNMPLEAEPGGGFEIKTDGASQRWACWVGRGKRTHVSHFATCTDPDRFRR